MSLEEDSVSSHVGHFKSQDLSCKGAAMKSQDPSRRRLLLACVATFSVAGCDSSTPKPRELRFGSLTQASEELAALASAKERLSSGGLNWAQTLVHCAQSIEYSMIGFPALKSRIFQATAGAAAFAFFEFRGRMSHDLMAPIPGAPMIEADSNALQALARLRAAMHAFADWQDALHPHFAYGALTKSQYELAHAMHLANHLSQFRAA